MPSETDLIKLYSDKILKLAAQPIFRNVYQNPMHRLQKDHLYVGPL